MFFKISVLKNFAIFRRKRRKIPVLEPLFNKVAGLQLSCEDSEIFKDSFFHKTPPVATSDRFINFLEKH